MLIAPSERLARGGKLPLSEVEKRFQPFQVLANHVLGILDRTKQTLTDPTSNTRVPFHQILEHSQEPLSQLVADVSAIGQGLHTQIYNEIEKGPKENVVRANGLRTRFMLGVLVALASSPALADRIKVVIYGDMDTLHVCSANLVDVYMPHPTLPDEELTLRSSMGALTRVIHDSTKMNEVSSGKLTKRIIENCQIEIGDEDEDERILRFGIEHNTLSNAIRERRKVKERVSTTAQQAKNLRYEINELEELRKERFNEIYHVLLTRPFGNKLTVERSDIEDLVVLTIHHEYKENDVVIRIPRNGFENAISSVAS